MAAKESTQCSACRALYGPTADVLIRLYASFGPDPAPTLTADEQLATHAAYLVKVGGE